jgi:biopolymer transport protein ExbD
MNILSRKKTSLRVTDIPTAGMADVSFLLLVFFLVTTKFDTKQGLGLVLPPHEEAGGVKVRVKEENLTKIRVNRRGEIAVGEEIVTPAELQNLVRDKIQENPQMVFVLEADRQAKYSMMVQALDQLLAAGAETISLATR